MTIYYAERVSYGKKSTPVKDREYRVDSRMKNRVFTVIPNGPVGTKLEIRKWAKKHKVKVKFIEKKFK